MPEKVNKNSGVTTENKDKEVISPDYTPEQELYLGALRKRLTRSKTVRDNPIESFDGMSYPLRCSQNRRLSNSYIRPRRNRQETSFTTGTSRRKLMVQLASLLNLSLEPDITVFNDKNISIVEIGEALENIIEKNNELDSDEEKRIFRFFTLIEQGEVFVEVLWKRGFILKKTLSNAIRGKFNNVKITSRLTKALGKLTKNVIKNEKVYLGDMSAYPIENQPHLFTVDIQPIEKIRHLYKDFEMFEFVSENLREFSPHTEFGDGKDEYNPFWTLSNIKKGFVEIIKYQSSAGNDNEFQIILNGIPMLPIGYPITEVSPDGEYTIEEQIFSPINSHMSYGKGLMQILKVSQELEDEFWKQAILKTQQSTTPPMINNTGRILSSKVFMPATITSNIPFGKFKPLLEGQKGSTQSELAVLQMFRDNMEDNSSDPQVEGKAPQGDPTAAEVKAIQLQAEKMMGLTVAPAALLEKKLTLRSIPILLKEWLDPSNTKVDKVKNKLRNVYRTSNIEKPIDGQGMGQEIVEVVDKDNVPTPVELFNEEKQIEESTGVPTRKIVLNRDELRNYKYVFRVNITPTPKKTSNLQKIMFRDKASIYSQSPNFNMEWFEENSALAWGDNPNKVFGRGSTPVANNVIAPNSQKTPKENAPMFEGAT